MIEIDEPEHDVTGEASIVEGTGTDKVLFLERVVVKRLVVFDFPRSATV